MMGAVARRRASLAADRVNIIGAALSDISVSPTNAEVGYQVTPAGVGEQDYEGVGNPYVGFNTWLISGAGADYDIRCTVNSGDTPSGSATATWLNLASARAWTLTDTSVLGGAKTNNLTIEIRDATTLVVLDSAIVTMSADKQV